MQLCIKQIKVFPGIYMSSYAQTLMSVITDCFDNADIFSLGKILFFTRYNRLLRCWLDQKLLVSEIDPPKNICLHQKISGTLHFNFIFEHFTIYIVRCLPFFLFGVWISFMAVFITFTQPSGYINNSVSLS